MRRQLFLLALTTLMLIPQAPAKADALGASMADAAGRFLAALDEPQKAQASFAFDSPERLNWHWIPRERKGLPIKKLGPDQRALAFGLLNTGLSTKGAIRATTIMSLEEILRVAEHGTGPVRDSELYYVSVFGTPGGPGDWGWRVEGHHLALNFTLHEGKVVSATPFMFGSNPAVVRSGPRQGLRNLADIEGPAYRLFLSLNADQRKAAVVNTTAPEVTTTPNSAQPDTKASEGISSEQLDSDQKKVLNELIQAYAANFPAPVAGELLDQVTRNEPTYHFAWYGSTDPTRNHAFRIFSPNLLIDFNDTQNETNHIHTFFRTLPGDFGLPAPR